MIIKISKFTGISTSVLILFFITIFNGCKNDIKQPEIVLGTIMPLTGDAAVYGQNCNKGIKLAVDEINSRGGVKGRYIKIIVEDSQLQPRVAVSAFKKLVSINKVPAIIGPLASSCAMATAPLANQKKVVSFSPGASTPKLTDAGPYVFRNWQSDTLEAVIMAEYAFKKGWKDFAIFYVNNDFGVSLKDYFTKTVQNQGGIISLIESFEQGSSDFRTQIAKIKEASPDAIYLLSYPQSTPLIINQIKAMGINSHILGVAAFEDPSLMDIAGENAEGVLYTRAIPPSKEDNKLINFSNSYENRYGEKPGLISDTGYDAVYILAKAIESCEIINGEEIQKALSQIKEYKGVSGHMFFDENGDVVKPVGIKTVKDGDFIWLN